MSKIILIGTGNIGKRHLQAISKSSKVKEIYCYDVYKESLESVLPFCKSNNINEANIFLCFGLQEVLDKIDANTIVVIASTANGRMELFDSLLERDLKAIVVEKPVVQSYNDYKTLLDRSSKTKIKIYVNFIAHVQNFYQRIYKDLASSMGDISFNTNMPKWGMSTVGIHQIELFLWLTRSNHCDILYASQKELYEQKRAGFYDVSGSVVLLNEHGELANIKSSVSDATPSLINISSSEKSYSIYESLNKLVIVDKQTGVWIEDLNVRFVSQYMNEVVDAIIDDHKVILPDLAESFLAHKILFEYFEKLNLSRTNFT